MINLKQNFNNLLFDQSVRITFGVANSYPGVVLPFAFISLEVFRALYPTAPQRVCRKI
jgi:hypothetical protein